MDDVGAIIRRRRLFELEVVLLEDQVVVRRV